MYEQFISTEYLEIQKELHKDPGYAVAAETYGQLVYPFLSMLKPKTLLDYGAGKGALKTFLDKTDLRVAYQGYDPAVERFSARPQPAEMVVCIDVLEHVEEDRIDNVLKDIAANTQKEAVLTVATYPAKKQLPDGRNAHILVRNSPWWFEKVWSNMEILGVRLFAGRFTDGKLAHTMLIHCRNW